MSLVADHKVTMAYPFLSCQRGWYNFCINGEGAAGMSTQAKYEE